MASAATAKRKTRVDKFEERRRELGDAALLAMADLGYARTTLRTIADQTSYTHGLLHYYFEDKTELITYCVGRYKDACVTRYETSLINAATAEALAKACGIGLANALDEAPLMHRLWYDLRAQSMFEPAFRDEVAAIDEALQAMIWGNVSSYAELAGTVPSCSPTDAYALFDGLFERALLSFLAGSDTALADLQRSVTELFPRLVK